METGSPYRGFLLAVAVVVGLLGFVVGAPALLGFSLAWAVLLATTFVAARRNLRGLEVLRRIPVSAFENELVTVDVFLENHGRRAARLVAVSDVFGAGLADRQAVLEVGPLPPQHGRPLAYRAFVARQWGVYTVGPLAVWAWDPLGLWHAAREVTLIQPFEVYPRVVEVASLRGFGAHSAVAPRDMTEAAAGQSLLFRGVREFRAGDDVRRVHWPATAQRGVPMVREAERDVQPLFTLFVDLSRQGRAGIGKKSSLELLVRAGASLLWTAHRCGVASQVVGEGERSLLIPVGRGELHLAAALHSLITARQTGTTPFLELVNAHRSHLPPGSTAILLVVATTELDPGQLGPTLEALRAGGVRPLLFAIDAFSLPPVERPPVPAATARIHRRELQAKLSELQVPVAILDPAEDLLAELQRPDLFAP